MKVHIAKFYEMETQHNRVPKAEGGHLIMKSKTLQDK